jgi:integrase
MASFRKRGPYQLQAQVRKKGQPLQAKTFDTRAAAGQWARQIECEMDQGHIVSRAEAESTTLKELLERYKCEVTPLKKGATSESARIRALLQRPMALRIIGSLRGVDMARYRDERSKEVSPATVKRDLTILSHLFEVARNKWGIYVQNPARDIKLPPHSKARERRLRDGHGGEESEEARLLKACGKAHNRFLLLVVKLALETAMRQGELVSVRWCSR